MQWLRSRCRSSAKHVAEVSIESSPAYGDGVQVHQSREVVEGGSATQDHTQLASARKPSQCKKKTPPYPLEQLGDGCSDSDGSHDSVSPSVSSRSDVNPTLVESSLDKPWLSADDIPNDFLPPKFSRKVFLRALDLIDRCVYSVLLLIGNPKVLPLGNHKWPAVHRRWNYSKVSIFDSLTNEALLDFTRDGAVVVDQRSGQIHELTVKVEAQDDREFAVRGGCRTSAAFSVTRQHQAVAICKKYKPNSKGDVARGWVSVFSSCWSQRACPKFHCFENPTEALSRISEVSAQQCIGATRDSSTPIDPFFTVVRPSSEATPKSTTSRGSSDSMVLRDRFGNIWSKSAPTPNGSQICSPSRFEHSSMQGSESCSPGGASRRLSDFDEASSKYSFGTAVIDHTDSMANVSDFD